MKYGRIIELRKLCSFFKTGKCAVIKSTIRTVTCLIILPAMLSLSGCTDDTEPDQQTLLVADMPLHLEDHLDAAHIEGSDVPEDSPKPVEWRFDQPQPDWKVTGPLYSDGKPAQVVRIEDALRINLTQANSGTRPNGQRGRREGSVYVNLPDWRWEDWARVEVRARAGAGINHLALDFNLHKGPSEPDSQRVFEVYGDNVIPVCDGSVQTYVLRVDKLASGEQWKGRPWRQLGLRVACSLDDTRQEKSESAATIDILSVRVIPKAREALYAHAPVGVREEVRNRRSSRTIFTHTPGKLEYRLHTPQAGRLDIGLGVLKGDVPVTFRVTAKPEDGNVITLLEETCSDQLQWGQRCVDLSPLSGKTITLSLEVNSERTGSVAFWASPTVASGRMVVNTAVWDTLSPFIDKIDIQDSTNWKTVPANYGQEYSFKGDVVVENEYITAVFWSGKGRVVIYSKADSSNKKVEFVPLQLKKMSANISHCRILQNTDEEIALEVSFSAQATKDNLSAIFSFGKKQIVEIKPAENMKGISLLGPIEYGVVPSFISDDLIFDPGEYPSINTLHIPSENLFLGLLKGQNDMLVVTCPEGKQQMRLSLNNREREAGLYESVDFDNDGKSICLALLEAPGIWHKEELKPSYLEKDVAINWKRPFPAKWTTQLYEDGVKTTFRFRESKGDIWRAMIGFYTYPVWFQGERTYYHLGKKIPPKGETIIYFLERRDVPGLVFSPADILKQTLDKKTFESRADFKIRTNLDLVRPNSSIDPDDLARHNAQGSCPVSTCAVTQRLELIFKAGKEEERREYSKESIEDMMYFITQHRKRIDKYMDFAYEIVEFLKQKKQSNPDLKAFIDNMEKIAQEIPQKYDRLKESIKNLEYAAGLSRQTEALTQKKDPKNLPTFLDLGEKWRAMGGAQDDLVRDFHTTTRRLFQEAGYSCVNQPKAVEIAQEIRRRCEECLSNPSRYEIWPDY